MKISIWNLESRRNSYSLVQKFKSEGEEIFGYVEACRYKDKEGNYLVLYPSILSIILSNKCGCVCKESKKVPLQILNGKEIKKSIIRSIFDDKFHVGLNSKISKENKIKILRNIIVNYGFV